MDKINPLGIQQTQQQLLQEMSRMASASSAGSIAPVSHPLSSAGIQTNTDFSKVLGQAVNSVNQQQQLARAKQEAIEMGQSDDLMATMVESQKASISFSAMIEVRNKLTSALDQIMNISL